VAPAAPDACRGRAGARHAPFYSRSEIRTRLLGQDATAVHEYLDLERFRSPILYAMLPFRVPRALR